ncbi:RES domain-containing protein [bacterium]|nr:MAG: RES domain-containing protein [bacterium]
MYRSHDAAFGALYFGSRATPGAWRFDAPSGEYGVLYAGADPAAAFIETFGHETGARVPPFVTRTELERRHLSELHASRPMRLVDLRGPGLARMGADGALATGLDYGLTQRWSRALHAHPRRPDGLLFRARHDPSRHAIALFDDRVADALSSQSLGSLAAPKNVVLLGHLLDRYKFALLP